MTLALLAGLQGWLPGQTCSMCAVWNQPQKPFTIYGNTYYVGPHGLSSILVTSPQGDILIDGALAESAPQIAQHIRDLGFRLQDVKTILNTHVHHDHAGGIAELQRLTGARVLASPSSAPVLIAGGVAGDDPQYGDIRGLAPVANVAVLKPGETLRVGSLVLTSHATPGHTPGGTSWTWVSCEGTRCLHMVYADSISAVARPGYRFSAHPEIVAQFEKSFAFLETVPCDVLLTPHPDASDLWERLASGNFVDPGACRKLAAAGREGLKERLAKEAGK
jgi:metallo-beta-lactamase class B